MWTAAVPDSHDLSRAIHFLTFSHFGSFAPDAERSCCSCGVWHPATPLCSDGAAGAAALAPPFACWWPPERMRRSRGGGGPCDTGKRMSPAATRHRKPHIVIRI